MVKLLKVRYIGGKNSGFEHVMKEQLAEVLRRRGTVEILPDAPPEQPAEKAKKESKGKE